MDGAAPGGYTKTFRGAGIDCHHVPRSNRKCDMPIWDERQLPNLTKWLRTLPRPVGILTPGDLHAVRLDGNVPST